MQIHHPCSRLTGGRRQRRVCPRVCLTEEQPNKPSKYGALTTQFKRRLGTILEIWTCTGQSTKDSERPPCAGFVVSGFSNSQDISASIVREQSVAAQEHELRDKYNELKRRFDSRKHNADLLDKQINRRETLVNSYSLMAGYTEAMNNWKADEQELNENVRATAPVLNRSNNRP